MKPLHKCFIDLISARLSNQASLNALQMMQLEIVYYFWELLKKSTLMNLSTFSPEAAYIADVPLQELSSLYAK